MPPWQDRAGRLFRGRGIPARRRGNGMTSDPDQPPGEDVLLELNFVPKWARQPATANPYADAPAYRERAPRRPGGSRDRGAHGRGDRDGRRRPDGRHAPGAPGRSERDRHGRRDPRREPPPRGRDDRGAPRGRGAAPHAPRLPVAVSFVPDRAQLGTAVRKMAASHRAYPLSELAHLFLRSEAFHMVKLEVRRGRDGPPPLSLYQCRRCRWVALDRGAVLRHVAAAHTGQLFVAEDVEVDPPAGRFVCIARSTLDGTLLGPPNHHAFAERLQQLHAEKYGHLPFDAFRARVEMVRDPELIETWKREASVRRVYRRVGDPPDAPTLDAAGVRRHMEQEVAPGAVIETHRAVVPAAAARTIDDRALRETVHAAWVRENRFPLSLMMALRPALRHMGMHLFRAGDNHLFVTSVAPSPTDPHHAVEPIRRLLEHLQAHPGITREQALDALLPGAAPDAPARHELVTHMHWLVDKGFVIEFFDGTLAVPHGRHAAAGAPGAPGGRADGGRT